ncbi:MAG TPA: hypothetical protein VK014_09100 [Cyclobacteriaceae bacterium]|nr:hypothetical protein [Cyclobacteriaceae bacterium]
MIKGMFLLLLLTLTMAELKAQKFLLLQKGANQKTSIKYEEGNMIRYQQQGQEYFTVDIIKEIHPEYLVLGENILKPENITVVDIIDKDERNHTLQNLSVLMYSGAGLLLVAETVNSLYRDKKLSYSDGGLVVSGSLLTAGFILSKIKYRYFKQKGRNKIKIIYLEN